MDVREIILLVTLRVLLTRYIGVNLVTQLVALYPRSQNKCFNFSTAYKEYYALWYLPFTPPNNWSCCVKYSFQIATQTIRFARFLQILAPCELERISEI